jgi:DNA modification methylase
MPSGCLTMIGERLALRLIDDGWILRNIVVWHKPSVVPQSVKNRFTMDWEYVFFFVKQPKYYFEQQFEEAVCAGQKFNIRKNYHGQDDGLNLAGGMFERVSSQEPYYPPMRNMRSVWKVSSQAVKEAHFATFPFKLLERPIKAGCPVGGIVLDPFMGSGTTAIVARAFARDWIGIELNPEYVEIAKKRLAEWTPEKVLKKLEEPLDYIDGYTQTTLD